MQCYLGPHHYPCQMATHTVQCTMECTGVTDGQTEHATVTSVAVAKHC